MAEKKEKQYVSDNAQLMAEWDYEKNTELKPETLLLNSNKNVWWKCEHGHSWEAEVRETVAHNVQEKNANEINKYCKTS